MNAVYGFLVAVLGMAVLFMVGYGVGYYGTALVDWLRRRTK